MSEKKVYNTFDFTCRLAIPNETDKFKPYKKDKYDSGWTKEQLLVAAKTDESSVLLTIEDGYFPKDYKIKTFSKSVTKDDGTVVKGSKLEIPWEDRQKKYALDKVADFKKVIFDTSSNYERIGLEKYITNFKEDKAKDEDVLNIEKEYGTSDISKLEEKLKELQADRKEFISAVDLIGLLKDELPKFEKDLFHIRGNIEYSEWNGKGYQKFVPTLIEKAHDTKQKLNGFVDIFFNQNSLNASAFELTKKYVIDAFTRNYDGQLKKEIFVPIQFVIDGSKIDMNNPKHTGKLKFLVKPFEVEDDKIYELQYHVKFVNGAERKDITLDDLTPMQKEQVELGIETLDEIRRELGGNKFGDNINENRLFKINTIDFPNGAEQTVFTYEDLCVVRPEKETKVNNNKNNESQENDKKEEPEDDEQLF